MPNPTPPQHILKKALRYDTDTGLLYNRTRPLNQFESEAIGARWNVLWAGKKALNSVTKCGYKEGQFLGQKYYAHRIIWKLLHGTEAKDIDHINGDKADNRESNLRSVGQLENQKNERMSINNTSGYCGVHHHKTTGAWLARIMVNRKSIHLGSFNTREAAIEARIKANIKYGFHKNHGRV